MLEVIVQTWTRLDGTSVNMSGSRAIAQWHDGEWTVLAYVNHLSDEELDTLVEHLNQSVNPPTIHDSTWYGVSASRSGGPYVEVISKGLSHDLATVVAKWLEHNGWSCALPVWPH